jgi:hypothetical protein
MAHFRRGAAGAGAEESDMNEARGYARAAARSEGGWSNMMRHRNPPAHTRARPGALLERYLDQTFPTSDQVLLCCFGTDLAAERTAGQLRHALLDAGFTLQAAGCLVRVSPLMRRSSGGCYRVRKFENRAVSR